MFNEKFVPEVNKILEVSKGKEYINEEDVVKKLQDVGADIRRIEVKDPQATVVNAG